MSQTPMQNPSDDPGAFINRHIGPTATDVANMLKKIGEPDLASLITHTVPEKIRRKSVLTLPKARTEEEALTSLKTLAADNRVLQAMMGMGYAARITPSVILRN